MSKNSFQFIETPVGRLAYRIDGAARPGQPPLVLLQRFRGTMADWDPLFIERLAARRQVIRFDSAGVGRSEGTTPDSITGMASVAQQFLDALGLTKVDLFSWSMGGFIGQHIALDRPQLVNKLVVAGSGCGGVPEGPQTDPSVMEIGTKPVNSEEDYLYLFFTNSEAALAAGRANVRRVLTQADRGPDTRMESVAAQGKALGEWPGVRSRLAELATPTLVINGVHDVMVPSYGSYILALEAPDAKLVLYPDAGHAFLFQYIDEVVGELERFFGNAS